MTSQLPPEANTFDKYVMYNSKGEDARTVRAVYDHMVTWELRHGVDLLALLRLPESPDPDPAALWKVLAMKAFRSGLVDARAYERLASAEPVRVACAADPGAEQWELLG